MPIEVFRGAGLEGFYYDADLNLTSVGLSSHFFQEDHRACLTEHPFHEDLLPLTEWSGLLQ